MLALGSRSFDDEGSTRQQQWQVLVRQFRSLRASLLAHGNDGLLAVRVPLWALDVTLHAQDYAECLKSLQGLVLQLFPAVLQCHPPCQAALSYMHSSDHGNNKGDVDWGREAWMSAATEPSHVTGSQQEGKAAVTPQSDDTNLTSTPDPLKLTALWADSAGLLILYFTCVLPSKQALDVFSILRQLPPHLCQAPQVQFGVNVYAALAAGNIRAFLRMFGGASWRHCQFLNIRLGKVHEYGVSMLCAGHRRLAYSDFQRLLQPHTGGVEAQLKTLLEQLASRGSHAAMLALKSSVSGPHPFDAHKMVKHDALHTM